MDEEFDVLREVAQRLALEKRISKYVRCGHVACALLTDKGNIYTGISINAKCGIGFCAEHSAIADMLKSDESRIVKLVSSSSNKPVVPCGRCLEFIRQINEDNIKAEILINNKEIKKIEELLPIRWDLDEL